MTNVLIIASVTVMNRYRELVRAGQERGLTTTEVAILTFVLVGAASAIGIALFAYAGEQVNELPEDPLSNPPDIPDS